ncbi:hypothetical protein I4U23_024830 [Adineta vaga]|nr:hypothetical protein I4U23_024830 [Adineta vaga]
MVLLKEVREGIWGLSFGPSNTSEVAIDNPVRLTMAALEIDDDSGTAKNGITRVTIKSGTADKGPPTDLILCNLQYPSCLQQPLDIEFYEGQTLTFGVKGPHKVHLTGYILQSEPHEMCEEGHMHGGGKHGIFETADDSDSEDDDDDEEDDDDESDDDDEDVLNKFKLSRRHKLRDDEDQDLEDDYEDGYVEGEDQLSSDTSASSDSDDDAQPKASASAEKGKKRVRSESNGHPKKQEPKAKKNKNVKEEPMTPNDAESKKAKKLPKKAASNDTPTAATSTTTDTKKKSNSLEINDLRVGTGPEAKLGKTVAVYYTGRLQSNNKTFDSCTSGKPFRFRLGAGEVIRGWDQGVKGMHVGGKRRLTIPPSLAYGSQKLPDIPANSTLVFDVEVKNVF